MASLHSIDSWEIEADVVVLGAGLAGIVAALEAHELDPAASVVLVEKMPEVQAGGNSRVAGQCLTFPTDATSYRAYQAALNEPHPLPEHLLEAWVSARVDQKEWMVRKASEVGFELAMYGDYGAEFPDAPGSECIDEIYTLRPKLDPQERSERLRSIFPSAVYLCFKAHLQRTPEVLVEYGTAARDLIQDPDTKEVFGVMVEKDGSAFAVKARRGVIIATGGYEANIEMLGVYGGYKPDIRPYGSPHNTGDAIPMLQRAGAKLWHMRNHTETGGNHPGVSIPGHGPLIRNPRMTATSWIDIGADGRRFYPEMGNYHDTHFKYRFRGQWEDVPTSRVTPVHMIFDENTRATDRLVARGLAWGAVVDGYEWSSDNLPEIERGWIVKADSLRELALKIGRDPDQLEQEVSCYNGYAASGVDPQWGRAAEAMSVIDGPPYYALQIYAGLICTTGGAMRDARGRVLDHNEHPIPRLYEAGELGSFHSNLYQNGSFLTEAMLSGRWAGANAVRASGWDLAPLGQHATT